MHTESVKNHLGFNPSFNIETHTHIYAQLNFMGLENKNGCCLASLIHVEQFTAGKIERDKQKLNTRMYWSMIICNILFLMHYAGVITDV